MALHPWIPDIPLQETRIPGCCRPPWLRQRLHIPHLCAITRPSYLSSFLCHSCLFAKIRGLILPVVDLLAVARFHLQALVHLRTEFLPVCIAILHTIHPFIQILFHAFIRLADPVPGEVELVVAVVISL